MVDRASCGSVSSGSVSRCSHGRRCTYQENYAIGRFEGVAVRSGGMETAGADRGVSACALLTTLLGRTPRVAAFSDEMIRAIVKAGESSEPDR